MAEQFSVLMSLYAKEKPEYLRECLNSLLIQTVLPDEIVIVKDGPLTEGLEAVLEEYTAKAPWLYHLVPLPENKGLGLALAAGVPECRNELIARMDTDDVCRKDRFEIQLQEFEKDPGLDICGSQIAEFEEDTAHIVAQRIVPLEDAEIKKYQKRRDGFNHMSVMFRKSAVLRAGNYQSCMLMEDTYLWVNMFLSGSKAKNVDDFLVYVRIGKDMFERRGGLSYYKKYKQGRRKVRATGYIGFFDYHYTLLVQLAVALMPNKLRGWVFKKMLHRETAKGSAERNGTDESRNHHTL